MNKCNFFILFKINDPMIRINKVINIILSEPFETVKSSILDLPETFNVKNKIILTTIKIKAYIVKN